MDLHVVFEKAKAIVRRYPEAQIELEGADMGVMSDTGHEMPVILQNVVKKLGWPKPKLAPDIAISDLRYWSIVGSLGSGMVLTVTMLARPTNLWKLNRCCTLFVLIWWPRCSIYRKTALRDVCNDSKELG